MRISLWGPSQLFVLDERRFKLFGNFVFANRVGVVEGSKYLVVQPAPDITTLADLIAGLVAGLIHDGVNAYFNQGVHQKFPYIGPLEIAIPGRNRGIARNPASSVPALPRWWIGGVYFPLKIGVYRASPQPLAVTIFYRLNRILIIAVRHLASNDDLFQQRRGTMPLSKQLFENLLDLVEIKIGALQIVDREDQRELKHLET